MRQMKNWKEVDIGGYTNKDNPIETQWRVFL